MAAFADFILQRDLSGGAWVLKIDAATPIYLSTIPVASLPGALPILSKVGSLSQSLSYRGGTAQVTTITFTALDILNTAGTVYAASNALYSNSVIDSRCVLYYGDSTAATFNDTNFNPVWRGYVRAADERRGAWEIKCEGLLSRAKGAELVIEESFLTVAQDYQAKDHDLKIKGRRVMPDLPALSELASNATFDAAITGWTWACVGGSATWGATYGRTGGGVRLQSGAANTGMLHQTVALPSTHLPGRTYAVTVDAKTNGTATGTRYQGRVQIEVLDASSNVLEVSTGTARKVRADGTWGTHSACITVYHPSAASLKIGYVVGTDGSTGVDVDNFHCYVASEFVALKREVLAALSVDEATTPNELTVAHGALNTRENKQPQGEKGKFVKPIVGYGGDIALRLLTTTSDGTNGDYDWGDGFGVGIPDDDIDVASFEAARTSLPYHVFAFLLDRTEKDCLKFLQDEILAPMGAWIYEGTDGKLTLGILPETLGAATITLDDDDLAGTPFLTRKRDDIVNQVNAYTDYDYMGAVETPSSRDLGKKANNIVVDDGGPKGDTKYLGRWTLDENDHRQDGVFKDQDLESQGRFGIQAVDVKSKGLRGLPSYSAGAPCPLYNWGATSAYAWKSEEAVRSLATRYLTYYTVPVCYVDWPAFSDALGWELGSVGSLSSDYIPDVSTGGRGITTVDAVLIGKTLDPKTVTVKTTWLVLDSAWYDAPAANQPVYSYGTAPGSGNIDITVADADNVKAGNFPFVLSGTFGALIVKHNYGGVTGAVPDFNAYAYTEVRIQWNSAEDSHTKGKITVARFKTSRLMIALPGALATDEDALETIGAIDILWRYRDGTYSTAYSYGTATPGVDIEETGPQEINLSMQAEGRLLARVGWNPIKTRELEFRARVQGLARASWDGINIPPSAPTIGTLVSAEKDIQGTRRVEADLTVPLTFSGVQKVHVEVKEWDGAAVTRFDKYEHNTRGKTSFSLYVGRRYTKGRTLYVRAWGEKGTGLSNPTTTDANWELTPPTVPIGHSVTAGGGALPTGPSLTGLAVKTRKRNHTDFQAQWTTSTNYNKEIEVEITYDSGTTWEPLKVINIWNKRTTGKARVRVQHVTDAESPCIRLLMRDKFGVESSYYPSTSGTDATWWGTTEPPGDGEDPVTKWPWTFGTYASYDSSTKRIVVDNGSYARLDIPLHKQRIAMHGDWCFSAFTAAHKFGFLDDSQYRGYYISVDDASHVTLYKVDGTGTASAVGTQQTLTTTLVANTPIDFRFEIHRTKVVLIIGPTSQRLEWTDSTYRTKGWKAWFIAGTSIKSYLESLRVNNGGNFYNGLASSNVQANLDSDGFLAGANVQFEISSTKRKLSTMAAKVGSDIYINGDFIRERDPVTTAALPTTNIKAGMIQPFYESGGTGDAKYRIAFLIPQDFFGTGVPAADYWYHVNADNKVAAGTASTATGGTGGTGGTCFRGDMEVPTPDGPRRIDSLSCNDIILSIDQLAGSVVKDYVIARPEHEAEFVLVLNDFLAVTEEHYLFRWERGAKPASCPQISAGEFPLGGLMYGHDLDTGAPVALSSKLVEHGTCKVYSLTTGTKCFLIGRDGRYVLAHNAKSLDI